MDEIAEVAALLEARAGDGLLDVAPLRAVHVGSQRAHGKLVGHLDAVEATDAQFYAWALDRLGRARTENRLRARLAVVGAMLVSGCLERRGDEEQGWTTRKRSKEDKHG